jgi:Asp/Glu/Hydantoin racemase
MEQDFYRDRLAGHGLTVLVPPADDRADVHRIIYDELCRGVLREESRQFYRDVIRRLADAGAEGVVLGCTEIELLVSAADSPVPVSRQPGCTSRPPSTHRWPASPAESGSIVRQGGRGITVTSGLTMRLGTQVTTPMSSPDPVLRRRRRALR